MKQRKIIGIVLVLTLLSASLWGCAADGTSEGGTTAAAVGENSGQSAGSFDKSNLLDISIATIPTTGSFTATPSNVSQQRLRNMPSGWPDAFNGENGCFVVVGSVSELTEALSKRGGLDEQLNLVAFNDTFFRDYRLVVIPRCSNSGSVRYEADISAEATSVQITLQGRLDGDGTNDMADWLVFVALPLKDYPAELTVTVTGSAGNVSGSVTS